MPTTNEENIRRKKEKKLSRHFAILINTKKVKILNYQIRDYSDREEKGKILVLISQMKLNNSERGEVTIEISTDKEKLVIKGIWKFSLHSPGNYKTAYLIKEGDPEI